MLPVLLLGLFYTQVHGYCEPGFESLSDNCYALLPVKASWAEAQRYCEALGAELAVIENKQQEALIDGMLHRRHDTISTSQIWIGGTDLLQEGTWLAPNTLQMLTYFNWAPGEPDDLGGQHCLAIFRDSSQLQWDDNRCEVLNYALCQREAVGGPGVIG